ncbi:MAG: F0F1 ATP synthase subunit B [Nitrospirae bacterium]|nr:F0F1 ATP synthase subunit B [Nitrospirota bacterium]
MKTEHRQEIGKTVSYYILSLGSVLFALCLADATVAFASTGGAEQGIPWKDWLWRILNFAVLVFLLVKFLGKPVKEFLRKRSELIEKSMKEAGEAKELAKKALDEVQGRLKDKDKVLNELLDAARKAGETEKEALTAQGENLKNKILEQAKANIEYELQKAKEAIRSEAIEMSIELAEKGVKEKLGKKEQDRIFEEYLRKLEGKN